MDQQAMEIMNVNANELANEIFPFFKDRFSKLPADAQKNFVAINSIQLVLAHVLVTIAKDEDELKQYVEYCSRDLQEIVDGFVKEAH